MRRSVGGEESETMGNHITVYIGGQDVGAAARIAAPSAQGTQYNFQVTIFDLAPELEATLGRYSGKFSGLIEETDGRHFVLTDATVVGTPSAKRTELQVESGGWGIGVSVESGR
jgi:hypothetical protein